MFSPLSLSSVQFLVFPLFLLALGAVSLHFLKVPRIFLGLGLIGAICGFVFSHCLPFDKAHAIVVSALKGDAYQSESRIFREKINYYSHSRGHARATGLPRVLNTYADAEQLIQSDHLNLVVWGHASWISIAMPVMPARTLSDIGRGADFAKFSGLKLVTSVPSVGMSFQPRNETADFIAGIAAGLLPAINGATELTAEEFSLRELALLETADIAGAWTHPGHRALPSFLLGNLYSYRALQKEQVSIGDLKCAINALYKARGYLQAGDLLNADLSAAVINNLAVLTALQSWIEFQPKLMKRSKAFLAAAGKNSRLKNIYHLRIRPSMIAKENLYLLKGYVRKHAHGKKQKKLSKRKL